MRMHFNVVCGGASLRSACGRSGALLRVLLLLACLARPSVAVCVHCKGFFAGCTGGDACPLVKELKSNVATVAAASPTAVPSPSPPARACLRYLETARQVVLPSLPLGGPLEHAKPFDEDMRQATSERHGRAKARCAASSLAPSATSGAGTRASSCRAG